MKSKYYQPIHGTTNFHCPICNVYSKQVWGRIVISSSCNAESFLNNVETFNEWLDDTKYSVSKCTHCDDVALWVDNKIIDPKVNSIQNPNPDLGESIKIDYKEAANIVNDSPRAAAALLRLALQKLCKDLGEAGNNINDDIKELVKKGLNPLIQKAFDAIRITGNNAVHPGELDLDMEIERVYKMFELINFIADKMITEPKEIDLLYSKLPATTLAAVEKRDKK
jgi:hypothetical protein